MTLVVLQNHLSNNVLSDLLKICPEPGLSIDLGNGGSGLVSFPPLSIRDVGCQLIANLVNHPSWVGVRGELSDFGIDIDEVSTLKQTGGVTVTSQPTQTAEIVYDVRSCDGGSYVYDETGRKITYPSDVSLFHELSHAWRFISNTNNSLLSDDGAIDDENAYRNSRRLPLRKLRGAQSHSGGCTPPPIAPPTPPERTGCFIATAAYGSSIAPEVELLRRFRDDVIRKTRSGRKFFDEYW